MRVLKKSESCRKNVKIMCYADHFSLCFSSGKMENEFVVQLCAGEFHEVMVSQSFSEGIKGVFKRNWRKFVGVTLVGVGILIAIFTGPVIFAGVVAAPAIAAAAVADLI